MVVAHDVADDLGGLGVLLVELEAHLLHAVEDAAMHGLEAVTDVGECAADDDGHRVVEIRAAHLLLDIDREHEGGAAALDVVASVGRGSCGRWGVRGGVLRGGNFWIFRVFGEEIVSHDLYSYYTGFRAAGGAGTGVERGARKADF